MVADMTPEEQLKMTAQVDAVCQYPGLKGPLKSLDIDFVESTLFAVVSHLKPRGVGQYSIRRDIKKRGEEMTIVSDRNWLLMGYAPLKLKLPWKRIVTCLVKDGQGLLMSDSPQEMFLQYDAFKAARGKVLVGGLGLGMYATMIANKPEVESVTVVEISKDVVRLCRPTHPKIRVVRGDFWKYIKKQPLDGFDFVYVDIYYSTGCHEYKLTVLPMKKIFSERIPNTPVMFWAEREMATQFEREEALRTALAERGVKLYG